MDPTRLRRRLGAAVLLLAALAPRGAAAQEPYVISGTTVDASSQRPLAGVTVSVRNTNIRTVTDASGRFTLRAPVEAGTYTLSFTRLGREVVTRQVALAAAREVTVAPVLLAEDAVQLEQIVVTGTGAPVERRQVGNTVATVQGEEIARSPGTQAIDAALQGRVAGAVISENSGQPGGGVSIRLRGTSSILGGAEPLIVVDGVIIDNSNEALIGLGANAGRGGAALSNRLSDLAPGDVERVEVLKGAAAAALYGSRANNGVIQIFTKRGRQGDPVVRFRTSFSASETPGRYDLVTLPFAGRADVVFGPADSIGQPVQRFDLQDQIFRTGYGMNSEVSVSGGTGGTTFYLSGNFSDEDGILETSDYQKRNARVKLSQAFSDRFTVTANANLIQTNASFVPEGEQTTGVLTGAIFVPTSFDPNFDPLTGRFPISPLAPSGFSNPLDVLANWEAPEQVARFVGGIEAEYRPMNDLTVRYLLGIDDYRQESKFFRPPFSINERDAGLIQNPIRLSRQVNSDLTATHEWQPRASVGLSTTAGFRHTRDYANTIRAAASDLPPGQRVVSGATQFASQGISEVVTVGGFLQERLSLLDRIFLTGGVNYEGSSAFGAEERYQFFPRLGLSWVVDQEPFWASNPLRDVVSRFRLRAAYGETGGQPPGAYLQFENYFDVIFAGRSGFVASTTLGNPNLQPERQREYEAGFDAGLFADRARLEFTYYDQRTSNLILAVPLSPSTGAQRQFQNIGVVSNRGVEVGLTTQMLTRRDFDWSTRLTYSSNRNRVEQLNSAADTLQIPGGGYPNAVIVGQPIGVFYGRGYLRDEQGEIVINPATGLGERADDFRILGDPNPDFVASLGNDFRIHGVELGVLFDGRFGNDVINFTRRITEFFGTDAVVEQEIQRAIDRKTNPDLPQLQYALNARRISNYEEYTEDGSFVKLREISLGYRFEQPWVAHFGASSLGVRVAGRNLYTWTDYSGLDPEVNLFAGQTVARGVDFATTPIPRTLVVELDFNF